MKLEEATETNKGTLAQRRNIFNLYEEQAQQLGIEALKVLSEVRHGIYDAVNQMLPGETEE